MNEALLLLACGGMMLGAFSYACGLRGAVGDQDAHVCRHIGVFCGMVGVAAFFVSELLK